MRRGLSALALTMVLLAQISISAFAATGPSPSASPLVLSAPTPVPGLVLTKTKARIVLVSLNTPVIVHLNMPISSQTAKIGDTFQITVMHNVASDGMLVIAKGALGQGHVSDVRPAKYSLFNQKPAVLMLTYDWIVGVDGEKIQVSGVLATTPTGGSVLGDTAASTAVLGGVDVVAPAVATVAGGVFAPVAGILMAFGAHGKGGSARIGTADALTIFVRDSVHITSDTAAEKYVAPGFAH